MTVRLVSVVVIGRNEGARLESCLRSVTSMERVGFTTELIYVDSASTDESAALAESFGARVVVLQEARPTAAAGRNAGWRVAQGEIVLFLDGDTILHPAFVREALPCFEDSWVAVVWGHRRETLATASLYNRVLDLDWIYAPGEALFCGGDALFRRETLERTGGFDETLIAGEEPELSSRIRALGLRILHLDLAMTGHDLGITQLGQYWRRAARAGHAYAEVSSRRTSAGEFLWREDSRRNVVRASVLLVFVVITVAAGMLLRSMWPVALALTIFGALALRTAWKARWKSPDKVALLLYGVHSQVQQIPIFFGQVRFWTSRRAGRRVALVEYKRPETPSR